MFIARTQVEPLKHAREPVSGILVKLFFIWLFFCMSSTRDTSLIGNFLFVSGGALSQLRCLSRSSSRYRCHFREELYSAGVINRSTWCSQPGTWRISVGRNWTSGFYELPLGPFNYWVAQGVARVRDRYSSRSCGDLYFRCLAYITRCQEFHWRLSLRNFFSASIFLPQALYFVSSLLIAILEQSLPNFSILLNSC